MRADVVVAGAGLAGSAIATLLARAGRRVVLLEKDRFPRHKLCGEFLSPESQSELRRLGSLEPVLAARPAKISRARFSTEGGAQVGLRLPGEGLGLSRYALDALLFAGAQAAGAQGHVQAEVRSIEPGPGSDLVVRYEGRAGAGEVQAGWVVAAHGRRARLDRALERPFMEGRHPYVGLKRHHRPTDDEAGRRLAEALEGHVEIHAFDGGYCGMSFVETGAVNVCMLLREAALESTEGATWDAVRSRRLVRNPQLAARLEALEPAEARVWAVAQVPFVSKARADRGVLYVGDAAGMIAPLAGDGQAMALSGASALADLLLEAPTRPGAAERAALGARWDARWRRRFGLRMRLSLGLQRRLLDPRRAERTVRTVGRLPGLADLLARLTRG